MTRAPRSICFSCPAAFQASTPSGFNKIATPWEPLFPNWVFLSSPDEISLYESCSSSSKPDRQVSWRQAAIQFLPFITLNNKSVRVTVFNPRTFCDKIWIFLIFFRLRGILFPWLRAIRRTVEVGWSRPTVRGNQFDLQNSMSLGQDPSDASLPVVYLLSIVVSLRCGGFTPF